MSMRYLYIKNLRKKVRIDTSSEIRIGSGEGCQLKFKTTALEALHCVLKKNGNDYRLEAKGPVVVNNSRTDGLILKNNDVLKLGPLEIVYLADVNNFPPEAKKESEAIPALKEDDSPPSQQQAPKPPQKTTTRIAGTLSAHTSAKSNTNSTPQKPPSAQGPMAPSFKKPSTSRIAAASRRATVKLDKVRRESSNGPKKRKINPLYVLLGAGVVAVAVVVFIALQPGTDELVKKFNFEKAENEKDRQKLIGEGKFEEALSKVDELEKKFFELPEAGQKKLSGFLSLLKGERTSISSMLEADKQIDKYFETVNAKYTEWSNAVPDIENVKKASNKDEMKKVFDKMQLAKALKGSVEFAAISSNLPPYKTWKSDFEKVRANCDDFIAEAEQKLGAIDYMKVINDAKKYAAQKEWSKAKSVIDTYLSLTFDEASAGKAVEFLELNVVIPAKEEWERIERELRRLDSEEERQRKLNENKPRFTGIIQFE